MDAPRIHPEFRSKLAQIERDVADVEGHLALRDIRFLALCAAHPRAEGEILEIGAYRGKSAIVLAKAAELAGGQRVVTIDPLKQEFSLDHPQSLAIRARLEENFRRKGVSDRIEFHHEFSYNVAKTWNRPIRLLWLDGDHRLEIVKQDLANFVPYFQDGAILLMHDVLSLWDGCARAFISDVLGSPHFGAAGVYGNIGWAQFRKDPAETARYMPRKERIIARLRPLLPFQQKGSQELHGMKRLRFRILRWRAQSHILPPQRWLAQVA